MRQRFWPLISACLLIIVAASCGTKTTEVQISAPLRPKYVAGKAIKKLYVADFIVGGEHDIDKDVTVNVNKEIKETLKSEFKDKSGYQIDDLKVPYDKTKPAEEVLKDPAFWQNLNIPDRQSAMIITGAVDFSNKQKGGLVTERVTNPRTGAEREVSSPADRMQLILGVNLYLIDGATGEKLFNENFREEEVYDDVSNVSLPLFYDVFERMIPKIVGVLVPYRVAGSRTLLEP